VTECLGAEEFDGFRSLHIESAGLDQVGNAPGSSFDGSTVLVRLDSVRRDVGTERAGWSGDSCTQDEARVTHHVGTSGS